MTAIDAEALNDLARLANVIEGLSRYPDILRGIAADQRHQNPDVVGIDWRRVIVRVRLGECVQIGDQVCFYPDGNDRTRAGRVAAIGHRAAQAGYVLLIVGIDGNLYYREDIYCWRTRKDHVGRSQFAATPDTAIWRDNVDFDEQEER